MPSAKKVEENVEKIIEHLRQLQKDSTIPRNVKSKFDEMTRLLSNKKEEYGLRINKALNVIEGISEDANLQPYTRTQIWNVASMLESI